jgi:hypothetical protein
LSSAILYGAIVVIWAGVLIPRWLRRESSAEETPVVTELIDETVADTVAEAPPITSPEPRPVREDRPVQHGARSARVVAARRRLLGMLVLLAIGSGILAVMQLAAWWVVLPPSVMLLGYLLLLREASRADAEKRTVPAQRTVHAPAGVAAGAAPAAPRVPAPEPVPALDAEVIDITARVSEEFFDQYADAKLRAVGD